ncbi:ATP-binding cassette domain-containing protein [Bradyrhizobium betae]
MAGQELTALNADGLRQARRKIGMIFQHFNLLSSRTACTTTWRCRWSWPAHRGRTHPRDPSLPTAGTGGPVRAYRTATLAQISGGQKQRVGIARALASAA